MLYGLYPLELSRRIGSLKKMNTSKTLNITMKEKKKENLDSKKNLDSFKNIYIDKTHHHFICKNFIILRCVNVIWFISIGAKQADRFVKKNEYK